MHQHDTPLLGGLDPAKVRKWIGAEIQVNGPRAGRALGRVLQQHGVDANQIALWAANVAAGAFEAQDMRGS